MRLHDNTKLFHDSIQATSQRLSISPQFIEKDYWITYVLYHLSHCSHSKDVVFKGGTSLSKGYGLIERFSEDIDIAVIHQENRSANQVKELIRYVEKCMTSSLSEIELEGVTSKGSRFRKSVFEYPKSAMSLVSNRIITEVNSFANPFPFQQLFLESFIAKFYTLIERSDLIEEYQLQPFNLNVLDKKQTLLEKLVSLIRFSFDTQPFKALSSKIRHFYDLYYLLNDSECSEFVESTEFHKRLHNLILHDKEAFDIPLGWQEKQVNDSVLLHDFEPLWQELKEVYRRELSVLAFSNIPSEKQVFVSIRNLFQTIRDGNKVP